MKVSEALQIVHEAESGAHLFQVVLACGFTPLHLQTFVTAHLQQRLRERKVTLTTGLYGDVRGTLRRARTMEVDAVAVVLEWPDLDPRLGYRNLGGWGPAEETDILQQARHSIADLLRAVEEAAQTAPVIVSLPTLRLPPAFHTAGWQAGSTETALIAAVSQFGVDLAKLRGTSVVNPEQLAAGSPPGGRFDLKSELFAGLPYTIAHASTLGEAIANLIAPRAPKKGIISDLDDTFWSGIVGEAGAGGVSWDLHNHAQLHGLYQQVLRALADQGVLVAIASKNDPAVVEQALERTDLIVPREKLFPIEVHWHAKSFSVSRVLKAWNVGADSVVFVDDSLMELEEVKQAHPGTECLRFPKQDYKAAESFLRHLRDLFGKPRLSGEDVLRRESLRNAAKWTEELAGHEASDDFLRGLNAVVTVEKAAADDPRSRELINKTNQFNLNARRYEAAEWSLTARRERAFAWAVAYQDKFGPLGRVAVIAGQRQNGCIVIDVWVMSCRAFSRRIEHQCLSLLFEEAGAEEIQFCFRATERNGPLQDFLTEILGERPTPGARLRREDFLRRCPPLFHNVQSREP
jgi:FkbH-like protein